MYTSDLRIAAEQAIKDNQSCSQFVKTIAPHWRNLAARYYEHAIKMRGFDKQRNLCPNCGHTADHEACNGRIE